MSYFKFSNVNQVRQAYSSTRPIRHDNLHDHHNAWSEIYMNHLYICTSCYLCRYSPGDRRSCSPHKYRTCSV